jgi:hypothetical protein
MARVVRFHGGSGRWESHPLGNLDGGQADDHRQDLPARGDRRGSSLPGVEPADRQGRREGVMRRPQVLITRYSNGIHTEE